MFKHTKIHKINNTIDLEKIDVEYENNSKEYDEYFKANKKSIVIKEKVIPKDSKKNIIKSDANKKLDNNSFDKKNLKEKKELNLKDKDKKNINNNDLKSNVFYFFIVLLITLAIGLTVIFLISKNNFNYKIFGTRLISVLNINNSDFNNINNINNNIIKTRLEEGLDILLIGVGGLQNDAPDLTDTIIYMHYDNKKNIITMLSIPRDLYVKYPKGLRIKAGRVNAVYQTLNAKIKNDDKALKSFTEFIGKNIIGRKIKYYAKVDFKGFTELIDAIGGIKVYLPNKFVDKKYPDNNWGYEIFELPAGWQVLNGKTALKYARSRHSTSDFSRSQRQQDIIKAVKDTLVSSKTLTNFSKLKNIFESLNNNFITNIGFAKLVALANSIRDIDTRNIYTYTINDSCFQGAYYCSAGGFLYTPERKLFNNQAISLPIGANAYKLSKYDKIKKFINIITKYNFSKEESLIRIFNASNVSGIAGDNAKSLVKYGFNIPSKRSVGTVEGNSVYSKEHGHFRATNIYYNGEYKDNAETIMALQEIYKVKAIKKYDGVYKTSLDKYIETGKLKKADIELILGWDYYKFNP